MRTFGRFFGIAFSAAEAKKRGAPRIRCLRQISCGAGTYTGLPGIMFGSDRFVRCPIIGLFSLSRKVRSDTASVTYG